jgi:type I restriction enzyme S subunit
MSFPRYPAYKDSGVEWLGEVPEHWTMAPLKTLLDIQNGSDYKAVEAEHGYPVIGSGGAFAFASHYHYDAESVLLGRKGTIDKPIYIKGRFWAVDTMYWSKIREGAYGRFAFYVCQCIPFQYYSTNTALPSMTKTLLGGHTVAVPGLTEQVAIATFLDLETNKIDALIAEQKRLIELLQEKRQAVISHAVTKGLNPNAPMKDSGVEWLGEVPEHWEVVRYKRFCELQRGHDLTAEEREDGPYPVVTSGGVSGFHSKYIAKAPGVVTGRYGSTGTVFFIEDNYWPHNTSLYIKEFYGNHPRHSWYLLQAIDLKSLSAKSAVPGIDRNDVHALFVASPPTQEQTEIADHLDSYCKSQDLLVEQAECSVRLLQERRSALISSAVTGQIDVRGLVPETLEK